MPTRYILLTKKYYSMTENESPAISVLMPVYNGALYLREAIDSILQQSFTDFEFLIINDGSTDGSEKIIRSYQDPRIRLVNNEVNIKLIATLNKGIALCKGKYIARMDADDISMPERLEKQYHFMEQNQSIGICGTLYKSFAENITVGVCRYAETHEDICFKQLYQIQVSHGTVLLRTETLKKYELIFDANYPHAEDYDFFTRASRVTRLHNLQFVGYLVRQHELEVSKKYRSDQIANSNIIRHREFEELGCPIHAELLEDYIELNHQHYTLIKSSPPQLQSLLEKMVTANRRSQIFKKDFLLKKLQNLWFHYCYNKSGLAEYRKSEILFDKRKVSYFIRAKWMIKNILPR